MGYKYCRYLNSLQNKPFYVQKKLIIAENFHIENMGFLVMACMFNHSCIYAKCR